MSSRRSSHKVKARSRARPPGKAECFDLLKLLYELFMVGRRNGLIALEEHVMDPENSAIFQALPLAARTTRSGCNSSATA